MAELRQLEIKISGDIGSGKTLIGLLIRQHLINMGMTVETSGFPTLTDEEVAYITKNAETIIADPMKILLIETHGN
jgi:Ni2+-binding GTPase involved in maturation of urease and hydrogenase